MTTPTDLDELDRLRAAMLHGNAVQANRWDEAIEAAYPVLAAELRELRAEATRLRELHLMHCGMAACDDRDTSRDTP